MLCTFGYLILEKKILVLIFCENFENHKTFDSSFFNF
jgi:hypothetical protein